MKIKKIERLELKVLHSLKDCLNVIIIQSTDVCVRYINPHGLSSFGIATRDKLPSVQRSQLFADLETYQYVKVKLRTYGKIQGERILFKRMDQSNFWGMLTSVTRIENNEVIYEDIITDITREIDQEHKLMEKTYLLDKIGSELDRFIYSASHDLRAPISTMLGLLSLMKMETNEQDGNYLGFLEDSLLKLDTHIRKLTVFSRISNDAIKVQPVDLKALIDEVVGELNEHSNRKRIDFELLIAPHAVIQSDYANVKTVLFHLIKNAFDFADTAKSKSFLRIKVSDLGGKMRIEVLDNGIGIEEHHLENVFKLFYRATTSSQGNGFGLYLVKEALVKLQGTIELHSDLGIGTSVVINIPNLVHQEIKKDLKVPLSKNTDTMLGK